MAALVLGFVGQAIGASIGGSILGVSAAAIGFSVGSAVGSAFGPTQKAYGPKLGDLRVTGTEYGQAIPWVAGSPRIAGQIAWASLRRETANTESAGGKGGGGSEYTSYTYDVDLLVLLTENEIAGVGRVWLNSELIFDGAVAREGIWGDFRVCKGTDDQLPDPAYEAGVGLGEAPAYRGRGYVFIEGLQLGGSGAIPNLTFEVSSASSTPPDATDQPFYAPLQGDNAEVTLGPVPGTDVPSGGTIVHTPGINGFVTISKSQGGHSPYIRYLEAEFQEDKLMGASYPGQDIVYAVEIMEILAQGSTPITSRFFWVGNADGRDEVSFGFYVLNGQPKIRINVPYQTTGGEVEPPDGIYTGTYRIVMKAAGGVDFYLNKHLLATSGPNNMFVSRMYLGLANTVDGAYVSSIKAKNLRVSVGPFTLDPVVVVTKLVAPLHRVVSDLMKRAGYDEADYSVADLLDKGKGVRGLALGNIASTRSALDILQAGFFFDAAKSDKIYFRHRAGVPVSDIEFADLNTKEDQAASGEPFELKVSNDMEIPSQVQLTYLNIEADYQAAAENSDRVFVTQDAINAVQLPLGMLASEAKNVADVILLDQIAGKSSAALSLPLCYARLEPSDVVTVRAPSRDYLMRLVSKLESGAILRYEAVMDSAKATQGSTITDESYDSQPLIQLAASSLALLDIQLLRDADNAPGHYVAVSGGSSRAALFESLDDVAYSAKTPVAGGAVVGVATTALTDWSGGNVLDESSSVTVNVAPGQLSSVTRAELFSSKPVNVILIGAEILRFKTATLVSPGEYVLSGLIRGDRDTAPTGHSSGEQVVLLTGPGIRFISLEAAQINKPRFYKLASNGQKLANITAKPMTPKAVLLVPFRPYNIRQQPVAEGTLYTWNRKTRVSEDWLAGFVPLGETVEAYRLDIYDGATLKRSLLSSVESVIYTGAHQFADFGRASVAVRVEVYQLTAAIPASGPATGAPGGPGAPVGPVIVLPPAAGASRVALAPVAVAGSTLIAQRASTYGSALVYETFGSTDGGTTFSPIPGQSALVSNAPPATAALSSGAYVSFDDVGIGQNFNQQKFKIVVGSPGSAPTASGAEFSRPHLPVAVASDGSKFAFMTQGNKVFTSTDGVTLTARGTASGLPYVYNQSGKGATNYGQVVPFVYQSGRWFILAPGQDIYYTTDANATTGWTKCNLPPPSGGLAFIPQFYNMAAIGSSLFITGLAYVGMLNISVIFRSDDAGSNWTVSLNPAEGALADVFNLGGRLVSVAYDWTGKTNVSDDSGATWTAIPNGLNFVDRVYPQLVGGRLIIARLLPSVPGQPVHELMYTTDGVSFTPCGDL